MPRESKMAERPGTLHLDGWAGRRTVDVVVIGETPR